MKSSEASNHVGLHLSPRRQVGGPKKRTQDRAEEDLSGPQLTTAPAPDRPWIGSGRASAGAAAGLPKASLAI
jgi:hypothetical protein